MSVFQGHLRDPDWHQKIKGPAGSGKKGWFGAALSNYSLTPGHNLSLGLRAEAEDLGLSAELRSLVAPPKGGPADFVRFVRFVFCLFLTGRGGGLQSFRFHFRAGDIRI